MRACLSQLTSIFSVLRVLRAGPVSARGQHPATGERQHQGLHREHHPHHPGQPAHGGVRPQVSTLSGGRTEGGSHERQGVIMRCRKLVGIKLIFVVGSSNHRVKLSYRFYTLSATVFYRIDTGFCTITVNSELNYNNSVTILYKIVVFLFQGTSCEVFVVPTNHWC